MSSIGGSSSFNFVRGQCESAMSAVNAQKAQSTNVMDQVKSYVPKIQGAWIGGDANEFAADVARRLVPAIQDLIAAIAGINLNLTKAMSIMDQADQKAKGMADQLGGEFDAI